MHPIFRATHAGAKLDIFLKDKFREYICTLPDDLEIIVRPFRSKRTKGQNSLYWEMLTLISGHTGHSKDELHEIFRQMFLSHKVQVFDKTTNIPRSTTSLNTKEFGVYLRDIRYFMLDFNVDLPIE